MSFARSTSGRRLLLACIVQLLLAVLLVLSSTACRKKGGDPANVGGGYTLQVAGGTLNDGSGVNGLVVLATIRDAQGAGPTSPWTVSISGPGIDAATPIAVEYNDFRPGSYMSWEWPGFDPLPGTYHAVAMNTAGTVTLSTDFTMTTAHLASPAPTASAAGTTVTLSWSAISGAHSYSYEICSPSASCLNDMVENSPATADFSVFGPALESGDYLVRLRAYSTNRVAVQDNSTAAPVLEAQENASEYFFSFPVNGDPNAANYAFQAALGAMDYGVRTQSNTAVNGLAIWTSLTDNNAPPAGNWNITVTDPRGKSMNYIYPANSDHHLTWYYSAEPIVGTYSILATYGTDTTTAKSSTFVVGTTASALVPLDATGAAPDISVSQQAGGDWLITWTRVSGALSYYVNIWADVWNNTTGQYEYAEVWSSWSQDPGAGAASSLIAPAAGFAGGVTYDVYVTAAQVDMTAAAPASAPLRADMSENYYPLPVSLP